MKDELILKDEANKLIEYFFKDHQNMILFSHAISIAIHTQSCVVKPLHDLIGLDLGCAEIMIKYQEEKFKYDYLLSKI